MDPEQVSKLLELEDKLAKIRAQSSSKLENQKHIAIILAAVEENINEQDATNKNIVNYLISFMSLLDQTIDPETTAIKDLQLATSTMYLLDIIFQYTPKKMLRSRFADILTKVAPCITDEKANAPLIRSAVGCLESLLIAQDTQSWNNTQNLKVTPKRGLDGLLELSLDPRPKVRKRAQDAIANILKNPPPGPTAEHVAAPSISEFAINALVSILEEAATISNKKLRAMGGSNELNSRIIHVLKLLSNIIATNQWPTVHVERLCDLLLEVCKTSDQFLVSNSFKCFETLFQSMAESSVSSGLAENKFMRALEVIFSLKPSQNDTHLAGAWIAVVAKGITTYAIHDPLKCFVKLPEIFRTLSYYLSSELPDVYSSAAQCLIAIITDAVKSEILLFPPAVSAEQYETVDDVIQELSEIFVDLLSIKYTHCAKSVLSILAAAFKKLRYRANPDFLKPLEIVGGWRTDERNFLDLRNETEYVIGAAVESMGVETVLGCLPLNLINHSPSKPGRAWLLPILRDSIKNSTLHTFFTEFLPLIKHFESKYEKLGKESVQLKVFQTVVDQIWSLLPPFCDIPTDLSTAFSDEVAAELSGLMYSNIELRTTICNALKTLVESNLAYQNDPTSDPLLIQHFPAEKATESLEYLSTKSSNLLAVLFNLYTQTAPNARGYILETIDAYLKITKEEDLTNTFNNVCGLLSNAFKEEANKNKNEMSATLLDLVISMVKYVPSSSYGSLFSIFNTIVNSEDSLIQKRAYRIIHKLSEIEEGSDAISNYIGDIEQIMLKSASSVQTSSKSARLQAIRTIVQLLPVDQLSFIVQVVAEVILSTKDVNEKSRETAFGILIDMAKKMDNPNGIVKLSQIPGYDPSTPDQPSSVAEFFKIMSAGLIGESQHMVSATITAYSCLVFEFKDRVDTGVLLEIYDTIELYLTSNSREIVKSSIGFAKVCCLGLRDDIMKPKVKELLPKLLRWSHEHTGHFKAKVKHIIERLIRRFGYEYIEANFPEEDMRLLANIRKSRNRSMRKQTEGEEEGPAQAAPSTKSSRFMSALDEALYSSEEESDDEEEGTGSKNDRRKKGSKQFIVESKENPLDLLDSQTLAHISSTRPKTLNTGKRRIVDDEVFSFDAEGKLVVKDDKRKNNAEDPLEEITSGVNAYLDAVKQGPVKGQKNRLKFKKGARAGNYDDFGDDDDEVALPKPKSTDKGRIGKKQNGRFKNKRKL
ncbi:ribosomal RNA-processing protein 12 [Kluyveromyces marxianus DMKU3-1042]|uniref:Ribosomal RNA-processing protein 12 n=1 Tax=Kluyveromyces marxianus (strain DMKU3-1042 / BCC 29191 / NBRC 104275) TaxID=1003335 RepID=W0T9R0_KLUMD|nr:ribosomal RNA-processing protein 12 [Kluyveromyces marxianus DMKU3-1042]BAO40352.1 ribosomal RNA-processing protein 12 [Kluyveromyces marxianus DMKU3-1042]